MEPVSGTVCMSERATSQSRRKVNYQIIKRRPKPPIQELPDDGVQHGPAPDEGFVPGIQKSHGNYFEAVNFERFNAIVAEDLRLRINSQHQGNIRPIDVGIEQAHLLP